MQVAALLEKKLAGFQRSFDRFAEVLPHTVSLAGLAVVELSTLVLLTAIQMVAAGGAFFSPRFVERRRQLERNSTSFDKLLSGREQELLRYVGAGYTDAEAAAALGTTAGTVQTHRRNVMMKLGVHSAQELQAYALKAGFTTIARLH